VAACGSQASTQTKLVIGDTSVGDVGPNFVATRGFCGTLAIPASLATARYVMSRIGTKLPS
jgi:hypothetical protein